MTVYEFSWKSGILNLSLYFSISIGIETLLQMPTENRLRITNLPPGYSVSAERRDV